MRKTAINTGACFLIVAILLFLVLPALHPIRDPGHEEMQDLAAFQRAVAHERLQRERPFVFVIGLCCGAGLACLAIGLKCPRER